MLERSRRTCQAVDGLPADGYAPKRLLGTADPPLVRIEHLSKTFPGQRALDDVSFAIGRDEIHALVGENGSGKSTLIKVLSGFHLPEEGGEITIDGEPLEEGSAADARRHGLRFVHQDLGLI